MTAAEYPRDALRVRRYVGPTVDDLELVDEYVLAHPGIELDGALDAQWCLEHSQAGRSWRIVIDDPAGDLLGAIVLEGRRVEWQDDRDVGREDDRRAFGWKADE